MQRTGGRRTYRGTYLPAGTTTAGVSLTLAWNDSESRAHQTSAAGRREGQGQRHHSETARRRRALPRGERARRREDSRRRCHPPLWPPWPLLYLDLACAGAMEEGER
jgi:hypothetical protein